MTFATAWDQLKAVIDAVDVDGGTTTNPHYHSEPKESSLLRASRGNIEGAYLLRALEGPNQWPAVSTSAQAYWVKVELEIATTLQTNEFEQTKAAEARLRAIYDALCLNIQLTGGAHRVYDTEPPRLQRNANDKRLIHFWRFKYRYLGS